MRFKIVEIEVRQALSRSGLPDVDYALNPYIGCAHGCLYCYAKAYTRFRDVVENWGSIVVVKKNIVDLLEDDVKRVRRGVVGIGTITDPYQPVEALYGLTRKSIEILLENGFRVSIQTKSSLVLRDLDILRTHRGAVDVGITITSTRNLSKVRFLEPYSTPPLARVETLKKIAREGVKTWIFYGPIVPGYNDSLGEVVEILRIAKETNSIVYFDKFRVKKFMYRSTPLRDIARESTAYDWDLLYKTILNLCREMNVICRKGFDSLEEDHSLRLDKYAK